MTKLEAEPAKCFSSVAVKPSLKDFLQRYLILDSITGSPNSLKDWKYKVRKLYKSFIPGCWLLDVSRDYQNKYTPSPDIVKRDSFALTFSHLEGLALGTLGNGYTYNCNRRNSSVTDDHGYGHASSKCMEHKRSRFYCFSYIKPFQHTETRNGKKNFNILNLGTADYAWK
jgi:hypothetical protein